MIETIYELLKAIAQNTHYFYPQSFAQLPVISYYEASDVVQARLSDGIHTEALTAGACIIDVWGSTPEETLALVAQIKAALGTLGIRRTFAQSLDMQNRVHHYSMRYEWTYNPLTGQVSD